MNRHSEPSPAWLAALLAPVRPDEFVARYWLKEHLLCRGASDRFSHLLSWGVLNEILEHHWRETYRFRLAQQGRDLAPASYADLEGFTPRIRARDVTAHLRRGATLSFDAIDELHEPLTRLAESFEAFFRGGTKINIYAGWRSHHGLDLHRDNQEIFILQLDGRKRWLLYGPSIDGIECDELRRRSAPPAGSVLDEIIRPGDLLYIPRGCYHVALPLSEPTLHLTLGVKTPRGIDLLEWMVERVRTNPIADRDVPCLAGHEDRRGYGEALRRVLLDDLDTDLVGQYLTEAGSNTKRRPNFSLPWSATPEGLPRGADFSVRLAVHSVVADSRDPESAAFGFRCNGRAYEFPRAMRWVVDQIDGDRPVAFSRLLERLTGRLDESAVRILLAMLVAEHLIVVREESAGDRQ
jgi:ribosomal protein L16 Arg81 hydroxylase